jgi:hypothetical protein
MADQTVRVGWYEIRGIARQVESSDFCVCTCGAVVADVQQHVAYHKKHGEICADKRGD